jgi:YHS domain-containing protein
VTKLKTKIVLLILLSFSLPAQEMMKDKPAQEMVKDKNIFSKDKSIFTKENMSNPIQASPIQANEEGVAIDGFDPVAYFTENQAIKGNATHSCQYQNRTWHFSSAENRDKFLANPEQFAPQYGGYCSHSIHENKLVRSDPQSFIVRDNKLYLYYNDKVAKEEVKLNKFNFTQKNNVRKTNWLNYKRTF